jgi:hypothetical protein
MKNFMEKWNHHQGVVLVAVLIILLIILVGPVFTPAQNGTDEGMELSKAFQMNGPGEWHRGMWNDQPLLLDEFNRIAFFIFGPRVWAARLLNLFFLGVLLVSLAALIPRQTPGRRVVIAFTWIALLSQPSMLFLSVSAMKELPAFAVGVASFALIASLPIGTVPGNRRLLMSGCLLAVAAQMKFTALLLAPCIGCSLLLILWNSQSWRAALKPVLRGVGLWVMAFGGTFLVLGSCLIFLHPEWSWTELIRSHWGNRLPEFAPIVDNQSCDWASFFENYWLLPFLAMGGYYCIRSTGWKPILPPLVFLLTVIVVHLFHRPWWYYYYLHFEVAWAMLAAVAGTFLVRRFSSLLSQGLGGKGIGFAACLAALSLFMTGGTMDVLDNVSFLGRLKNMKESPLVEQMRKYGNETRWIFTENHFCAFQARLPIPPKLLLLVKKRFWSGQITEEEVLNEVKRLQPEQLLLSQERELKGENWRNFVAEDYVKVIKSDKWVLYVCKRLNPEPAPKDEVTGYILKQLGLETDNSESAISSPKE